MSEFLYGNIKNNNFIFSAKSNFYEDKEIYISIDGKEYSQKYFKELKQLYKKYNEDFISKIDEYISIVIYDKENNKLIIVEDRVGTKKIYYSFNKEKNELYFSNNFMKMINKFKLDKEINQNALSMYFRNHYVNPPETIVKNIYKLQHGHYLVYENNNIEIKEYYSIINKFNNNKNYQKQNNYIEELKESLNFKLKNKIQEYLKEAKNDNIGFYISGGIDSSLLSSIAQSISKEPINTFSIGFNDKYANEADKSKRIAEYLKTNHHELYITEKEASKIIYKIPDYYNELFADPSVVATVVLNEFAKKKNINLAITGDGADQLFCGASVYDTIYKIGKSHRFINPFNLYINPKRLNNRKLRYLYSNKKKYYLSQCEMNDFDVLLDGLFIDSNINNNNNRFEQEKYIKTNNLQEKRMILDFDTFMCDRVVNKMNTAAYQNDILVRSPFLSQDIIENSFKIHHKYKYYNKIKKYILKQLLYEYVPKELFSDTKHGFSIPTQKWLKTVFYNDLIKFSSKDYIEKQNIFNHNKIQKLIKNIDDKKYTIIIWDFFIFQLWYDKYIN